MEYFFLLGRNPILSYAEIVSYLKKEDIFYSIALLEQNYLILDIGEEIELNIQEFGGVLKIGKARIIKNEEEINSYLESYFSNKRKFSYSLLGNGNEEINLEIREILKKKFRKEKLKAQIKTSLNRIKLQDGENFEMPHADVEFFYCETPKKRYIGIVEQNYSYIEVKKRDMQKPVRRESLAISPRLAKILINLTQTKKEEVLVDPFCGVGAILIEGLVKELNVVGGDLDSFAIKGARKNIEWLKANYYIDGKDKLIVGDSAKFPNVNADGIATEPALGEIFKKKLKINEAKKFIMDFEKMIIPVLKRMKEIKKPNAKLVLTLPTVRNYSVNIDKILNHTGLKVYEIDGRVNTPIRESRKGQFIGREIIVLI